MTQLKKNNYKTFSNSLLSWYDLNRRILPWRAQPGEISNPYFVYLSEIMLQQTVVKTVIPYFLKFVRKWPNINALAKAELHCLLYTSPSPRDRTRSRMPSSA